MSKTTRVLIVIFLGIFGVHKFIDKKYGMGILYLFTGGLFGIGWIIDIFKEIFGKNNSNEKSLMSKEIIEKINNGQLPEVTIINGINLADEEICHYADTAYTFKDKTVTTGYTGKNSGVSIRIMKGLTYRTGGSRGKAIRETQRTMYKGILFITSKRVIYSSTNVSFDKHFDKITSLMETKDGVLIQIGSNTYSIIVPTHSEFVKVFNMVKNREK